MSGDRETIPSDAAYRTAVVRLRQAAEWNEFDSQFQKADRDNNQIVPIVDANIVSLYLDPSQSPERVYVFSRSGAPHREPADPVLTTFAAITAEFLFLSTEFKIGNDSGRLWRHAPTLAPAHGAEVASMLQQILGKGRQKPQRRTDIEEAAKKVEQYAHALAGLERMSRSDQLDLVRSLPEALSGLFSTPLLEAVRWLRLTGKRKIVPLRELEWAKDPRVIEPSTVEIRRWYKPILTKKHEKLVDPADESQDVETRAYHDAEVLAQVIALNEKLLALPGKVRRRAVFITADDSVHAAYQEEFWSTANLPLESYVLRRPWQYVPILNAADIPNGYMMIDLFSRLKNTLDTALAGFFRPSTRGMFAVDYDWSRVVQHEQTGGADRDRVLTTLWREATDISTALCAGLAVQEYKNILSQFSEIARNKPVVEALIALETKIFDEIEGVQLTLVVDQLIRIVAKTRQSGVLDSGLAKHRMPYLFEESFDDILGEQSLDDFLEQPSSDQMRDRLTKKFDQLFSKDQHSRGFYFAGVIAAAANQFESASDFLRRALASRSQGARERNAIGYLQAVVTRLQIRDADDFRYAQKELSRLLEGSISEFEKAKLTSERASLYLTGYLAAILLPKSERPILGPGRTLLKTAKKDLLAARALLSGKAAAKQAGGMGAELLRELRIQLYTNMLCEAVVRTGFFEGRHNAIANDIVNETQTEISRLLKSLAEDHVVWLWVQLSNCMMQKGPERERQVSAFAEAARPKLDAIEAAAEGTRLLLDRYVFRFAIDNAKTLIGSSTIA